MEGLKAYYLKHGRLADDNMNIGVGSLDEELDGSISVSMTYELISILISMYVCIYLLGKIAPIPYSYYFH